MCGIFGIAVRENQFSYHQLEVFNRNLFRYSESRGKESAGIAIRTSGCIRIFKAPFAASRMIRSPYYRRYFQNSLFGQETQSSNVITQPVSLIGHSRLVTNGSLENHDNNQPVVKDGMVAVHNGIIVNDADLWKRFPELRRHYQVDTEIVLSLIKYFYKKSRSLMGAIKETYSLIEGYASMAFLFNDQASLALSTNNGSLYICFNEHGSLFGFSSEEYILRQSLQKSFSNDKLAGMKVKHVKPGMGLFVNLATLQIDYFSLAASTAVPLNKNLISKKLSIRDCTPREMIERAKSTFSNQTPVSSSIRKEFSIDIKSISALRRCSRCVLPETMPFIEFDERGICNYCRTYQKQVYRGDAKLGEILDQFRKKDGSPDCIVAFSGGRDSSYALHVLKTEFNMHPVAYTYDWGMITDLGRRNQARLCGKLGIEHILVSADIKQKRANIRKNVLAWLKKPDLGTVPLFMAGDKQYFYFANKIKKQMGIHLTILADNPFEETYFKFGFCGLPPSLTRPSLVEILKLTTFYISRFIGNPAFINSSILDTLGAFASFYTIPHDYLRFYQYLSWNEGIIESTLRNKYKWEVAADTQTTWRIGDGTAAFYNYIYYVVAGFTENDTFRSNQIREGVMSRAEALEIVNRDNQPRFESIQWYCNSIGIDFLYTLNQINQIPKMYLHLQK